jgi:hypothetical protein
MHQRERAPEGGVVEGHPPNRWCPVAALARYEVVRAGLRLRDRGDLMPRIASFLMCALLIVTLLAACGDDDDSTDDASPTSAATALTTRTATTATGGSSGSPQSTPRPGSDATGTAEESPTSPSEATATESESASADATATETEDSEPTETVEATEEVTEEASPTTEVTVVIVPEGASETEARLFEMLLTAEELGDQWAEVRREVPESDSSVTEGGICNAPNFEQRDAKLAEVEAEWQQSEEGPFFLQNIVEFPDDVVESAMNWARETVSCTEFTDEDGVAVTVTPIDDPALAELGDDAVGAVLTLPDDSGVTQDIAVIYVRVGTVITSMLYAEISPPDPTTAVPSAVNLASLAADKIEAAQ